MLKARIEQLFELDPEGYGESERSLIREFLMALDRGEVRAATQVGGRWQANLWVKKGILLAFRAGRIREFKAGDDFRFFDKDTLPLKTIRPESGIRLVPGGSSIRFGAFVAPGVTCMPPMYVNVGARVEAGSMIDSHALVGSCAQIGQRVHLSAGAQVGGVLEPVGARPVVIEDEALIGGNTGIFEGVVVRARAVISAGVILTGSTPIFDLVEQRVLRGSAETPLEVPPAAVVVPGARMVKTGFGREHSLSIATPLIVKYRDSRTEASIQLEDALR